MIKQLTRFLKQNIGYSLLEILFAFIIVAISVIPMIGFITDKYRETPFIESYRFAQERGYDIMVRVMNEVPFEMLRASVTPGGPGAIVAQSSSLNPDWNSTYATKLLNSIFPGSSLQCVTTFQDRRNISYYALLEVTDISDPTPNGFGDGVTTPNWQNPATWKELYFDFYRLPEYYLQTGTDGRKWDAASNSRELPATLISPYRFYGSNAGGKREWGPAERKLRGASLFTLDDKSGGFPRDQKDRTKPWAAWGNIYCTMKKLKLTIKWNLHPTQYGNPEATTGRPMQTSFVAFKANISPIPVEPKP